MSNDTLCGTRHSFSPNEGEEVGIHLILMRRREAVWRPGIDFELCLWRDLYCGLGCGPDRNNLVVVPMDEERRHGHLFKILCLIRFGKRLDALVGCRETGHHALKPEGLAHTFRDFRTGPVVAVEGHTEVFPELRAISQDFGT